MSDNIIIRNGRIRDKYRALNIWKEMVNHHRDIGAIEFEVVERAPKLWLKFYENYVRSRNKKVLIAEKEGIIIGYLLGKIEKRSPIYKKRNKAHIKELAVTTRERNKGVGTKLLEAYAKWARKSKLEYLTISVVPENEIGKEFWKKHGFQTLFLSQGKRI